MHTASLAMRHVSARACHVNRHTKPPCLLQGKGHAVQTDMEGADVIVCELHGHEEDVRGALDAAGKVGHQGCLAPLATVRCCRQSLPTPLRPVPRLQSLLA